MKTVETLKLDQEHDSPNKSPTTFFSIKRELVIPISREGKTVAFFGVGNKQIKYSDNDIE